MIATRLRQFGMLAFSMLLCAVAFFQMFERTTNGFPQGSRRWKGFRWTVSTPVSTM